ncbi:uncharacterized protein LOC126672683 [Mercurialis annua]|uniref:uncharacterized protein LOC126672683 n=1 Tax=Mercurialis annua TaxID=3986 RepID=UPI00215EDA92|nr:uncharacterized protein LOC126672683 [Mercurialis annua]
MCRGLKTYLQAVDYKKWARAHCENNRHKVMTTNIAESMNSRIKAGKDLPITTLLEYLQKMVQEWSYANMHLSRSTFTNLSKRAEDILNGNYIQSLKLVVSNSNDYMKTAYNHTTKFIVDLKERTCTCWRFDIDEILCPYAMAILKEFNQDPYKFLADESLWNVPEEVAQKIVNTPQGRIKSGRPRKKELDLLGKLQIITSAADVIYMDTM